MEFMEENLYALCASVVKIISSSYANLIMTELYLKKIKPKWHGVHGENL